VVLDWEGESLEDPSFEHGVDPAGSCMAKRNSDPSFSTAPTEAAVLLLPPGYRIGDYEVSDNIGRGGFGTVFKAVHAVIGKVVAIKVLHPNYSAQPHMVSRFVSEARAVNRIEHKNIIDIFGFGNFQTELGQLHYYVMEYLQGESLEDFLLWHGALSIDLALSILRPIARALHAAHDNGIAHRDLKADNVFLAEDREGFISPKLLDFGIAKLLLDDHHAGGSGHRTREGVPVGTPGYMSPEQCQGHAVDHRTDIYALGILAYRMLGGELPFDDRDSYMNVLFSHIHKPPPLLREVAPDVPESVERSILGMLAKSPADRPQTMLAAQQSLEAAAMAAGLVVPREGSRITLSLLHQTGTARGSSSPGMLEDAPTMDDSGSPHDLAAHPDSSPSSDDGWDDAPTHVHGARVGSEAGRVAPTAPAPEPAQVPSSRAKSTLLSVAPMTPMARTARTATTTGGMSVPETIMLQGSRSPVLTAAVAVAGLAAVVVLVAVLWTRAASTGTPVTAATAATAATGPGEIERAARPAPPATAPAAPAAVGAPSDLVSITIDGPPENTEVYGPTGLVGVVPGIIQLTRRDGNVILSFKAEGYLPATRTVRPTADATIEVELVPKSQQPTLPRRRGEGDESAPSDKGEKGEKGTKDGQGEDVRDQLESPF
jgi:serine/threonine-protein kinase